MFNKCILYWKLWNIGQIIGSWGNLFALWAYQTKSLYTIFQKNLNDIRVWNWKKHMRTTSTWKRQTIRLTRNSLAIISILHLVLTETIFQFYFYLDWSIYCVYSGRLSLPPDATLISTFSECEYYHNFFKFDWF